MSRQRGKRRQNNSSRRRIIEEALHCFSQKGLINTTMDEIRIRAGVSNGSLYHHFPNKEVLAAAVYLEGIKDYQEGLLVELEKYTTARDGVFAIVRYHLHWVENHPDWTLYLFQMRWADFMTISEKDVAQINMAFFKRFDAFFSHCIENGTLKDLPRDILFSLLIGPCQDYARQMLSGHSTVGVETAVAEIAEGVWQALRTRSGNNVF